MKKQLIYQIIRKLADRTLPASQRDIVLRWLIGPQDTSEKEETMFRLWNDTNGTEVSDESAKRALQNVKEKLNINKLRTKHIQWFQVATKYAAILLLPLITGLVVWGIMENKVAESSDMIECFVPKGEQQTITLSDGTNVTINSGSLFIYPKKFYGNNRKVHLSGEAYFKVSRNEGMPFLISTGPLNIKVLGTTFNVEAYPEDENITTTLEEGSVKVYRSSYPEKEGIIMKPDERLVYHNQNDKFELYKVESEDFTAWTNGELYFVEQPLSVILKTIERRCNVFFRYDSQINLEYTDKKVWYSDPTYYHYVIMRLGRAYLNYAEVMLRQGNIQTAIEYINKTRTTHGGLPALSTSLSLDEAWKVYKRERRVELVHEGDRYWSLLRWGKADGKTTVEELNKTHHSISISEDGKSFEIIPLPFRTSENERIFTKKRYLFPVPEGERVNNPALDQNEGW